jgi:hypothetical protein
MTAADEVAERKSAVRLCQVHKSLVAEGDRTAADYTPGSTEIQTAMLARRGLKALFRSGDVNHASFKVESWNSTRSVAVSAR